MQCTWTALLDNEEAVEDVRTLSSRAFARKWGISRSAAVRLRRKLGVTPPLQPRPTTAASSVAEPKLPPVHSLAGPQVEVTHLDDDHMEVTVHVPRGVIKTVDDLTAYTSLPENMKVFEGASRAWTAPMKGPDGEPAVIQCNWVGLKFQRSWEHLRTKRAIEPVRRKPHLRPEGMRRCLAVSDAQVGFRRRRDGKLEPLHDRRSLDLNLQVAALEQPDVIVFLGDNLDLAEVSTKYPTPSSLLDTTQASVDELYWWLARFRATCPSADLVVLGGNHEDRVKRALRQYVPALETLAPATGELPAVDYARILDLESLDARFVPYGEEYWLWDVRYHHGHKVRAKSGQTVAAAVDDAVYSEVFGHVHRAEVAVRTLWGPQGPRDIFSLTPGCNCRRGGIVPHNGDRLNWQQALGMLYQTGGTVFPTLALINQGRMVWNGRVLLAQDPTERIIADLDLPMALDWLQPGE